MIDLVTLGRASVRRNGQELPGITGHKQKLALLAYVAVEGPVTRDRLLAVFWPEREEERARHSLSQVLYALKRELDEEYLRVGADSIALAGECRVDVKELERAAEEGDWERVVALYGGRFLDQFVLSGAPEFEKWQTGTGARLARLARKAFRLLVEKRIAAGQPAEALALAARWVALDPLEDEAQHIYITLLARSGNRSGAIQQYETFRSLLARELHVEPLEGTAALAQRIRAGEIPEFRPLSAAEMGQDKRVAVHVGPAEEERVAGPLSVADLFAELRRRRVFQVGAAYLVVAWLAIQFTGTLVEHAVLPDWVFRVVLFFLLIGFPFALILAWAQEPAGAERLPAGRARPWLRWAERVPGGHVLWFLGALVVVLLSSWIVVERGLGGGAALDRSRVVIFPLAAMPEGNDAVGEDIATLLGYALEASGEFRFVDGWYGSDELRAAGMQNLSDRTATAATRTLGAAFYVRGRVRLNGDSARIVVELHDIVGDSLVARGLREGPTGEGWIRRESRAIADQLLTAVAPPGPPAERSPWASDTSAAMAQFTAGEREYRRARFREALEYFRRAVELDSTYAPAALRGALVACWLQEYDEAQRLVELALRRPAFLPPHRAQFAYGLRDYLAGAADSAISHFKQALAIAPEMWEAAARLGEVYVHLLPDDAPLDSLAEAAFLAVHEQVPDFRPTLYHLIEFALRDGDVPRAEDYLRRFRESDPDPARLAAAQLMLACVRDSPDMVDWRTEVVSRPAAVFEAAQAMGRAGRQAECARAGWTAILTYDRAQDAASTARRFSALLALQSLLVAEGRTEELLQLLEADTEFPSSVALFYILDTAAGADLEARAHAAAQALRPTALSLEPAGLDLWFLGLWAASQGDSVTAGAVADSLAALAARSGERIDRLMAASMEARATLARADTARALALLEALHPTARPADSWYPWESLGGERIALAQLLFAAGRYEDAVRVAASLDAPARPAADLVYLPASLALRARAARRLGDSQLEQRSRARLRALGRDDLLGPGP